VRSRHGLRACLLVIWHALIGLEARVNGQTTRIGGILAAYSGLGAVTWLGDLGGGAGMLALARTTAPGTRTVTRFSESDDGGSINLEGDMAAYSIAKAYAPTDLTPVFNSGPTPIADALSAYLGAGASGSTAWAARSGTFLTLYGGTFTGSAHSNRASVVATFRDKIEEFGAEFISARMASTHGLNSARLSAVASYLPGAAQEVAEVFVDALVANIASPTTKLACRTDPAPTPAGAASRYLTNKVALLRAYESAVNLPANLRTLLGM
jgi:hypothetical protein